MGRFEAIGIPLPQFAAPFVGFVEIFCAALLIVGVFTRMAALPLLAVILTAIGTTKIPELWHVNQGVWFMLHDARTDFSMLLGLIFLLIEWDPVRFRSPARGRGSLIIGRRRTPRKRRPTKHPLPNNCSSS